MIVALNYRIEGRGQRILLLHPVGLDLTFFDSLVAELVSHYQILRVDLRGHGLSPGGENDEKLQIQDFAEDVHALLCVLGFRPTAVVGLSFGGMVAQELVLHHPGDASALVASACGSAFSEETRKVLYERGIAAEKHGMASLLDSTMDRWFTPAFRERGEDAAARERLLRNNIQNWKKTWQAISGLDTAPRLHTISIPTLCLAAENDLSTPPAVVRALADAIPGARFVVVPKTPHMLFLEVPQIVGSVIRNFLESTLP
jgi:3-oxoadipate enol-lactonase